MRSRILILIAISCLTYAKGNNNTNTFGIQYKPIIPFAYFNSYNTIEKSEDFLISVSNRYSNSFGMIIRHDINQTFSIESAINYNQKNYIINIKNQIINLNDKTSFGIRSYEVPLQLLTYVQVSKLWFLNVSFGSSYNIVASDVFSQGENTENFFQNTYRKNESHFALLANIGGEYRTLKKGNFYLGISLHRPWNEIARVYPEYEDNINTFNNGNFEEKIFIDLSGSFVTVDLRYFFKNKKN